MKRAVSDNPCSARALTITPSGITISSTGASGTVNTSTSSSSLERGNKVILSFSGGSAGGFVSNAEYFVIPGATSGSFQITDTQAKAFAGTYLSSASGNAGAGTAAPIYRVGGTLFFGTGGNAYLRGVDNQDTGLSSFVLHKNIPDGSAYPYQIKDFLPSGSTTSDMIVWNH